MVRSCRLARRTEQDRNRRATRASDGNIRAITTPEQEQSLSTRRERERIVATCGMASNVESEEAREERLRRRRERDRLRRERETAEAERHARFVLVSKLTH